MSKISLPKHFHYKSGELHCEQVPLSSIAKKFGTPTYVYSASSMRERVAMIRKNAPDLNVYFAVKANSNIHLLKLFGKLGCGADIVSGGELFRSALAGIPSDRVVFSGVGKTDREIEEALQAGIHMFNIESVDELRRIERIASRLGVQTNASLRINPNIDAKTHPYISTGLRNNKFGLSSAEVSEICSYLPKLRHVTVCGLSCHIGSQILSLKPLSDAWKKLLSIAQSAPFKVTHLDLGGGLGIPYSSESHASLTDYAKLISKIFKGSGFQLGVEPGRSLIGPSSILLTSLITHKDRGKRGFYVVDAAMNDLLRPALYEAIHPIVPVRSPAGRKLKVDVVGPVCESSDTFQVNAELPASKSGDRFAFLNAGAYGMSMASQYNSRPMVAEVLVDGSKIKLIRKRETYANLVENELV